MALETKYGKLKVNNVWAVLGPILVFKAVGFLANSCDSTLLASDVLGIPGSGQTCCNSDFVRFMILLMWLFVRFVAGHITGSHPRSLFQISWALITNLLLLRLEPVKSSWTHHKCNVGDSWRLKLPHASWCYMFLSQMIMGNFGNIQILESSMGSPPKHVEQK